MRHSNFPRNVLRNLQVFFIVCLFVCFYLTCSKEEAIDQFNFLKAAEVCHLEIIKANILNICKS